MTVPRVVDFESQFIEHFTVHVSYDSCRIFHKINQENTLFIPKDGSQLPNFAFIRYCGSVNYAQFPMNFSSRKRCRHSARVSQIAGETIAADVVVVWTGKRLLNQNNSYNGLELIVNR